MISFMNIFRIIGMAMIIAIAYAKETVVMKALVLTTTSMEYNYITNTFQAYGIPFDILKFSSSERLSGNLKLYDSNNEPKYNLIVINGGGLVYESSGSWISALTDDQWAYLEEYEVTNGVRRVVIEEEPTGNTQIQLEDPNKYGTTKKKQPLIVETSDEVVQLFKDAGVKTTAPLDINNIYHSRVVITDTDHTRPFLYYSDSGSKGAVAATITTYPNGREAMSFFFGFGSWSQTSIILNHLWLTWGTHSLFNGFRRVYFTPHIDDVLLSSDLVDVKHNKEYSHNSEDFRTKPSDYEYIAKFQKEVLKIMPEGSFFRSELAFNGNGILINVDYDEAVDVDGERYVELEFIKEPGTGDKRWPKENYQLNSSQLSTIKKDDLFSFFANNSTIQKEFFWSSHTFSHENLDNASRGDVDNEIRLNIEIAEMLGLIDKEWWSGGAIITPQISGLHNKDALEIFEKYGIHSATGDLSRPTITNLENPYLPYFTTLESSNFEGFPVIPRTPTEIYYHCSTREEDIWMNNHMYEREDEDKITWDQLAENEAQRTLLLMLNLRHEAHQFHQANLRHYPKEGNYGESLLEDWTRAVVKAYTKLVDWPLISIKIDRQAEVFLERYELENCGHESRLILENGKIVGVKVTATKSSCTVPITVPVNVKSSSLPSDVTLEQVGHDPLTVWIPLKKGETKTIELSQSIPWKANTSSVVKTTTTDSKTTTTASKTTTTTSKTTTTASKTTTTVKSTTTVKTTTTIKSTTTVKTTTTKNTSTTTKKTTTKTSTTKTKTTKKSTTKISRTSRL